ncbi:MAG: hypothetical protein H7125_06820 [Proteobacteria bacterium]|nr:hypothetical protein [Burkholderiales bacterium]
MRVDSIAKSSWRIFLDKSFNVIFVILCLLGKWALIHRRQFNSIGRAELQPGTQHFGCAQLQHSTVCRRAQARQAGSLEP